MSQLRRKDDIPSSAPKGRTILQPMLAGRFLPKEAINAATRQAVVLLFPQDTRKRLADAANITPNGAKQIIEGHNGLSLDSYLNIAKQYPEFDAMVRQLLAMERDCDPAFQRALVAFTSAFYARRG